MSVSNLTARSPLIGLMLGLSVSSLPAQTTTAPAVAVVSETRQFETRAQLEAAARTAEAQHRTSAAWLLRSRLQKGDFQEGDRIVLFLTVQGVPRMDTLVLRSGKIVQFAQMGDLSLEGVLRSELTDTLRHHLSKYMVNPDPRATPLLPIAVFGAVASPGYYYTPADVVLRDVIMKAGGARDGDLNKTVVRRSGETIWDAAAIRIALTDGLSLDRLHLRAGDEIFVPERRRISMTTVMATASASATLFLLLTRGRAR